MTFQRLRRLISYLLSFAFGRGVLFVAPFVLANYLPSAEYGLLETALAAASVLAAVATLGTASAVPLVLLRHNVLASFKGIISHHLLIVGVSMLFLLVGLIMRLPDLWLTTALLTMCLALQRLASVQLKTQGRGEACLLMEASLLALMAVAVWGASMGGSHSPVLWACIAALALSLTLCVFYLRTMREPDRALEAYAWKETVGIGIPLMLGGLVSLLATTSGRLGMGLMAEPTMTADYAVLSRAAALPIIAHQVILVAKFRDLFAQPEGEVERATIRILVLVGISALCLMLVSPWLGVVLGIAFDGALHEHKTASLALFAQAILWSAIALNDLVITRHQVMQKVLPFSIVFLGVALLAGWGFLNYSKLSVNHFVLAHSAVMLAFYCAQSCIMHRLGLGVRRISLIAVGIYALLLAAVWMLSI